MKLNDIPSPVELCLEICLEAHEGQRDKLGKPYAAHPIHVAQHAADYLPHSPSYEVSICAKCVGLLHDVVEDTDYTFDDLENLGVPPEVVSRVRLLTHEPHEPYEDYIRRVGADHIARSVKFADIAHNMSPHRLSQLDDKTRERLTAKYAEARRILTASIVEGPVHV